MEDETFTINISIDLGEGISEDRLFHTTQTLRSEIREAGVQSVEFERTDIVPEGAMPLVSIAIGTLAIALLPKAVPPLIDFLKDWKLRHMSSTLTFKHQVGEEIVEATIPATVSAEQLSKYMDVLQQQLLKSKGKKLK